MRVSSSAPITSTDLAMPPRMYWSAMESAKSDPAHAADTSKAAALVAPIFAWTKHAAAGKGMSGVTVPQTMRSRSPAFTPACWRAAREAFAAMSLVASLGAAMRREPIPVRSRIHASLVSMPIFFARSSLVTTCSGR